MSEEVQPQSIQLAGKMYAGIGAIGRDPTFQKLLSEDPYLFAAYMASLNPVFLAVAEGRFANAKIRKLVNALSHGQTDKITERALSAIDERHDALKMINELKQHLGAQLTASYVSIFIRFTEVFKIAMTDPFERMRPQDIIQLASEIALDFSTDEGTFGKNLSWLSKMMGMNQTEANLITICTLQTVDAAANIFFRYLDHAIPGRADLMNLLSIAVIFDHEAVFEDIMTVPEAVSAATRALSSEQSKPLAFGMARFNHGSKRFGAMSNFWISILFSEYDDVTDLCDDLLIEAKDKDSASGALARIDEGDRSLIDSLIAIVKEDSSKAKGCNILCYGAKRFDKRSVVINALKDKVDGIYELRQQGVKESDLPSIAWIAQERLRLMNNKDKKTYVLLVERAEDVLSRSMKRSSLMFDLFGSDVGSSDKNLDSRAELDSDAHLLTQGPTITFWLTNFIGQLADEAVGQFLSHIEIKGGTRADRKAEVQKIATKLNLPDELVQQLSKYSELGAHQVSSAAALTTLLNETGEAASKRMLTTIESSQKALNRTKTEEIRESVTKYDLGLLNLSGKFSIDKIVKAMTKRPSGTLCFYGLPGTGKTQLAEHIALALDKPLLIKRASDIFSMYLGESEKKVKEMFEEGQAEDAIVLLDEADSFMRDRKLARASWEVSIVNELLTRMERFPGVFICATNLFEQLDAAALRRFTFKLQFHSLNESQRIAMFRNETGITVTMNDEYYERLHGIKYLTPGDFATVKRQANMLDEQLSPNDWLEQLYEESKAKMNGIQNMGLQKEDDFILEQQAKHKP
jgi:hypothetical protein